MNIYTWLPYSLVATTLLGVSMAFFKSPAAKGHSRFATLCWSSFVSLILSLVFFHSFLPNSTGPMVGAAALWGVSFVALSILQMYALTHIDTSVLFPITTTSALILTIGIGLSFFKEQVSFLQAIGMLVAASTIFLFLRKKGKHEYARLLLYVGIGIVFFSTFNKVLQKIVAGTFDIHSFQIYQYLFTLLVSLVIAVVIHKKEAFAEVQKKPNIVTGSIIGVLSFFGSYCLFFALTLGPISLINTIHSLYVLPTAITAAILFREKLTAKTWLLITGTIIAIALIRLG